MGPAPRLIKLDDPLGGLVGAELPRGADRRRTAFRPSQPETITGLAGSGIPFVGPATTGPPPPSLTSVGVPAVSAGRTDATRVQY
jgi:hypothetical protein